MMKRKLCVPENDGSIYNGSDVLAHRNRSYFLLLILGTSQGVKGAGIIFSYYVEWKEAISYCFGVTKESL